MSSHFGHSVAGAGDVNGDGFADVVIGAWYESPNGAAHIYLGSATGLELDPSSTVVGERYQAEFGAAVAGAGDVNGDGYSDVIVGEPLFSVAPGSLYSGAAHVYLGSSSGLVTTPAWSVYGGAYAQIGGSVASAGDVNGDGYSDVIVGSNSIGAGQASVYLGSIAGLALSPSWSLAGSSPSDWFGTSVASAGDVNGDGYSDVIVGAPGGGSGSAQIYLGSATGLDTHSVWVVEGENAWDGFGSSVASAGDVDGDGFADVLVGAPSYDGDYDSTGRAYLFMGHAAGVAATPAWTFDGRRSEYLELGHAVASAGDVNEDGYDDVVIGAPERLYGPYNGRHGGRTLVFLGAATGLSPMYAWSHADSCPQSGGICSFGGAVASAGDVDGDRRPDVIVGRIHTNGTDSRNAHVYGAPGGDAPRPIGDLDSDSRSDILWAHATGYHAAWLMEGAQLLQGVYLPTVGDPDWKLSGSADLNRDGHLDLILHHGPAGATAVWLMNGNVLQSGVYLPMTPPGWTLVATGDFDCDDTRDLLWRNEVTGENAIWLMDGTSLASSFLIDAVADLNWKIVGTGDFYRDGTTDILWHNVVTGENVLWVMDSTTLLWGAFLPTLPDVSWYVGGVGDYNDDGHADILWRNSVTGENSFWEMSGERLLREVSLPSVADTGWRMVGPR